MRILARGLLTAVSVLIPAQAADAPPAFDKSVKPLLAGTCAPCHNDRMASGGFNTAPFSVPSSVLELREGWERILQKVRSGETPPKGIPRPPEAQINDLMKFVQGELDKADRSVKP